MSFTDRVLWGTPFVAPAVFLFIQLMQGKAKSVLGSIIFIVVLLSIAALIVVKAWKGKEYLGAGPCAVCDKRRRPLKRYLTEHGRDQYSQTVCWVCELKKYGVILLYLAVMAWALMVMDALTSGGRSVMGSSGSAGGDSFELGFMVVLLGGIPLYALFHKLNPAEIIKRRMRKGGLLRTDQDLYSRLQGINSELMAWTQADGKARVEHWNREARLIGEILNRQGGKARMLQVHQMLGLGRGIESAWDGIGQWRG